jgi:signal transduction protein with GAF and PtsI domain
MSVRINYFEKLSELCQAFGKVQNRRELLEKIFASAMEIMEGKAACLYLVEPGKAELMPVAQKGLSESYFRSQKSMLVQKIVPLVLKKGFFFCRDAAADLKLASPDAKKAEGIASILAVPVMVKGRNIGVFCLFTATPRDFSPD